MKKMLMCLLTITLFATFAFPAAGWNTVKVASTDMSVTKASFIDASTGWIVYSTTYPADQMGRVQKTTNGGANWTTVREPDATAFAWNDMEFIDANVGYACGENGVIYKTVNSGTDWTMIGDTVNYKIELYDLDVVSPTVVYFAGKDSTILKTTDGATFTKLTYNFNGDMTIVDATRDDFDGGIAFFNENRGVVAVDHNKEATIWWTEDGGTIWHPVKIAAAFPVGSSSKRVYDVAVGGDSTVALAGYHHTCLVSTNGGRTFTTKSPFSLGYVYSEFSEVIDNNTIITGGGSDNIIMKTTDAGANWDTLNVGTGQTLASADFIDANTGYWFCDAQQWFKTVNGGVSWTPLNTWPGAGFWGLAFPTTDKIVLTASSGGEMTISSNGGTTWSYPDNLKTKVDTDLFECEFISATTGLMGGTTGNLLKTIDGAATLALVGNPMYDAGKAINAIHYLNADTVFAGGGSGNLMHSFDGGATWTAGTAGAKTIYDVWTLAGNKVVAVAGSGEYYTSTDAATFTKVGAVAGTPNLRAVDFRNGVGIVPAAAGKIFRTTAWNTLPTLVYTMTVSTELYDVEFVDDNTVYVVGQYGTILKSIDAGLNWTVETSPTTEVLQKVRFNNGKLWAVGQNGTILMNPVGALAGEYYIPKGTHEKGFATLGAAVTALNLGGTQGAVNLLLDADTLREASFTFNAPLSAENNVVVKPAPGRNVCLIVTGGTSMGNGVQMVGFNTGYVTFDGSNNGTDSRNLTVTTEQVSPVVDVPFGLNLATADEVVLKNLKINNFVVGQTNFRYGAVINDKDGVEGFRVENCQIGTATRPVRRDGLAPWGSAGTLTTQFNIVKNEIYCGTRGITTLYLTDSEISGNEINILPTTAGNANDYMHGIYITGAIGNTIIHDNVINCLEKSNRTAGYVMGIAFAGNAYSATDVISVVNNMVNVGVAEEDRDIYGIGLRSTGNMGNLQVYHNTVKINEHVSTLISYGIGNRSNGTGPVNIDLKNNIINNGHTGNAGSAAIGIIPTTSVLVSDFNVLASSANFVNYLGTSYADLVTWQATAQDAHSVSKAVEFTGTSDLHLTGASIGDNELGAPAIEGITTDIDGDARHAYAYKGADEASIELFSPEVSVTLLANTAGVPDTMQTYSTVQIRGSWPFTWDNTSQGIMTNIGGDYWSYTYMIPRDSLQKNFEYKFCTFPVYQWLLTSEMNGWESANNRVLDMKTFAGTDTTLQLQYVDGWKSGGDYQQFDKPFTTTDSIDVYVRVDAEALIKAQAFNPTTEQIGLRGSNAFDSWSGTADFNWNKTLYFTQENVHSNGIWGSTYNGTYFFNGVIRCPQEWAGKEIQYKFIIGDAWGRNEDNNRSLVLPADGSDVTVHWVWYNNVPPAGFTGQDTSDVTFSANMTKAIENNGFEIGDTLLVKYGYFGSSVEVKTDTLRRLSGSENYFVTVNDIPLSFGEPLYYQYYMIKNTAEQREVYFNFEYTGDVASEAERRAFTVTAVTTVIGDIQDSDVDARRMPIFRNNQLLSQAVTLAVECDLRPAIFQVKAGSTLDDIQSGFDITPAMLTERPDTVFTLGLYMNGPLSNNAEGTWATWGGSLAADTTRKMFDDGTHGDVVSGDTVYTLTYLLDPVKSHRIGQEFKYGIGGGDNESGYGLNHIENIDDTNPTYVLYTQWGSINPNFYNAWDFDNPHPRLDIRKDNIPVVTKYALDQNFPNPFNPTTQIRFAVPERSDATLTIYNALGQMVNKVVFTNLNNGVYSYFWDGKDLRGNNVASGVYLYELRAGDKFRDLKKMVLLK